MLDDTQNVLLASRYTPPTIAFNAVERTALLSRLEDSSTLGTVVIAAPAGSGKSTLLAQYASRHQENTCWYSVGPDTSSSLQFWSYIIHALGRTLPTLPLSALLHAFAKRSFKHAIAPLLNALESIDSRITLIIDGTQNITSGILWDEIGFFCNNAPSQVRVILSGRCIPQLPMTRMTLEGRTTRISFAQLAFDFQESSRLWSQMDFSPAADEGVSILEDSHGWPAVVMAMARTAKAAKSHGAKAPDIVDNPIIIDFLREEVFDGIPAATFRFLELTSILPYFAESDCREFLQQIDENLAASVEFHLETLYRDFALLERVVGRGYRCNPVVANYLKNNLATHDKETYRLICTAMAAMLEARNKPSEAIPLALEGEDWTRAIRLILMSYSQLGMTAGFIDLCNWLEQIPAEYFESYPELSIAKAMALIPTGKVDESEALLNRAEELLRGQEAAGSRPANDFMVHCEIPIIRAYNNAFTVLQGDDLLLYSAQAEQRLGDNRNQAIEGSVMLMNGIGSLLQGNYQQAEKCLTSEMENTDGDGSLFTPLLASYYLAMLEYQRGNLKRAENLLDHSLSLMLKGSGMRGFTGIFHVLYAWVLYDMNRLDECLEHALVGLAESREWEAQTSLADAYEVLACAYRALGRESEAQGIEAQRRKGKIRKYPLFAHLSLAHVREHAFIDLKGGMPKSSKGTSRVWYQRQVIHQHIVQKEWEELISFLDGLLDEMRNEGLLGYVLEAQVLHSLVLMSLNHNDKAMEALGEALQIAEEHGHTRIFIDEGDTMREALQAARKAGVSPSFAAQLLRMFPGNEATKAAQLSQRELDVLVQLAKGLTPKQIAAELYVSVGTVRTHLHHIYNKLGVSGQTEAVLEAQRQKLV